MARRVADVTRYAAELKGRGAQGKGPQGAEPGPAEVYRAGRAAQGQKRAAYT